MDFNFKNINPRELQGNVFELIGDKWMLITASKRGSGNGECNTMTASWGGMGIMWGKPIANCVVRPVRYTYEFMEAADYFTLTFFSEKYRDALNVFGKESGRDINKSEVSKEYGLAPETMRLDDDSSKSVHFFTPFDIMLVCEKIYYQDIDPAHFINKDLDRNYPNKDYHRMYFGEIIRAFVKQ
jgi:hypothetical protein